MAARRIVPAAPGGGRGTKAREEQAWYQRQEEERSGLSEQAKQIQKDLGEHNRRAWSQ